MRKRFESGSGSSVEKWMRECGSRLGSRRETDCYKVRTEEPRTLIGRRLIVGSV